MPENQTTYPLKQDLELHDEGYKSGYRDGKEDGIAEAEQKAEVTILKAEKKSLQQEVRAEKAERKIAELQLEQATQNT